MAKCITILITMFQYLTTMIFIGCQSLVFGEYYLYIKDACRYKEHLIRLIGFEACALVLIPCFVFLHYAKKCTTTNR